MKINDTDPSRPHLPFQSRLMDKHNMDHSFEDVLKQQTNSPAMETANPNRVFTNLRTISDASMIKAISNSEPPMESALQLLETVEHYGNLIGDVRISLRKIEPVVQKMKKDLASMEKCIAQLPANAPIRPVLEDTRVLTSREIDRFETGYYVER